jgi:hypothetical protein
MSMTGRERRSMRISERKGMEYLLSRQGREKVE